MRRVAVRKSLHATYVLKCAIQSESPMTDLWNPDAPVFVPHDRCPTSIDWNSLCFDIGVADLDTPPLRSMILQGLHEPIRQRRQIRETRFVEPEEAQLLECASRASVPDVEGRKADWSEVARGSTSCILQRPLDVVPRGASTALLGQDDAAVTLQRYTRGMLCRRRLSQLPRMQDERCESSVLTELPRQSEAETCRDDDGKPVIVRVDLAEWRRISGLSGLVDVAGKRYTTDPGCFCYNCRGTTIYIADPSVPQNCTPLPYVPLLPKAFQPPITEDFRRHLPTVAQEIDSWTLQDCLQHVSAHPNLLRDVHMHLERASTLDSGERLFVARTFYIVAWMQYLQSGTGTNTS